MANTLSSPSKKLVNLGAMALNAAIDQPPKESTIEWYERQKHANQPMVYDRPEVIVSSAEDDRKMNRIFYFCVGLAICFVVWKLKN